MFAIPGFSPSREQNADMAGFMRLAGKCDEAIEMGQEFLPEMPMSSPLRWKMRFELASSLREVNRLGDFLNMALAIDDEGGHIEATERMKAGVLLKIYRKCDDFQLWMSVKERALRAHLDIRPNHAATMHNLGLVLCKLKKFDEGKHFLKRAKDGDQTSDMPINMEKAFGEGIFIENSGLIPRKKLNP